MPLSSRVISCNYEMETFRFPFITLIFFIYHVLIPLKVGDMSWYNLLGLRKALPVQGALQGTGGGGVLGGGAGVGY